MGLSWLPKHAGEHRGRRAALVPWLRRRAHIRPEAPAACVGAVAVIPVICPLPPVIVRIMPRRLDAWAEH
jgi:hypothetical protein